MHYFWLIDLMSTDISWWRLSKKKSHWSVGLIYLPIPIMQCTWRRFIRNIFLAAVIWNPPRSARCVTSCFSSLQCPRCMQCDTKFDFIRRKVWNVTAHHCSVLFSRRASEFIKRLRRGASGFLFFCLVKPKILVGVCSFILARSHTEASVGTADVQTTDIRTLKVLRWVRFRLKNT